MIRLTLRQFRTQALVTAVALGIVAIVAAVMGPHLVALYDTEVARCATHNDCQTATSAFLSTDRTLRTWLGILVIVVPGLMGIFWGAPLVARELEAGTYRLIWTQSVSRTRWLVTKVAVIGTATMAVAGLLSLMVTWWASPLDRANMQIYSTFDERALVPIGYAAFAFALGVTAGIVIRRVLPAMATTLVAFVAARLTFTHLVRPHLASPMVRDLSLSPATAGYGSFNAGPANLIANPPNVANTWVYSVNIVDKSGQPISPQYVSQACPKLNLGPPSGGQSAGPGHAVREIAPQGAQQALQECLNKVGTSYHLVLTYEPANHFWGMQWAELGAYLGVALVLVGCSVWWVRKRLS
jgi:hypothetical protein